MKAVGGEFNGGERSARGGRMRLVKPCWVKLSTFEAYHLVPCPAKRGRSDPFFHLPHSYRFFFALLAAF